MMTSRAEFRLVLREDNTYERLASIGFENGLLTSEEFQELNAVIIQRSRLLNILESETLVPNAETQAKLQSLGTAVLAKPIKIADLLRRDEINSSLDLKAFFVLYQ